VTVGALSGAFTCEPTLLPPACPAGSGNFRVLGTSGDFDGPPATSYDNQRGFIHNMNQVSQPINQLFLEPNWMVFNFGGSDVALDLTFVFSGLGNPATCFTLPVVAGQTCTPSIPILVNPITNPLGLSPFTLANTQTGSTASFSVRGTARRLSTHETSQFDGLITASFNKSYQATIATILGGGTVTNTYAGTFEVTPNSVPEPSTITLLLTGGLFVMGGLLRRR